ncbi:hypothetical protein HG530_007677 [Fusarium avenaceum]|nr:hypothetical protein HG530_007677 [Fusarium avenaceum]
MASLMTPQVNIPREALPTNGTRKIPWNLPAAQHFEMSACFAQGRVVETVINFDGVFIAYYIARRISFKLCPVILQSCFDLGDTDLVSSCIVTVLVSENVIPQQTDVVVRLYATKAFEIARIKFSVFNVRQIPSVRIDEPNQSGNKVLGCLTGRSAGEEFTAFSEDSVNVPKPLGARIVLK